MRTTLTLEKDVAARLERLRRSRKSTFKQIVNEALREGLRVMSAPAPASGKPYVTPAVSLGGCRLPNLDNIADVLAIAEGEDYR
jgi:hypothetical protein